MAHWAHRAVAQQAWNYLNTEIAANILLVQESVPPMAFQNKSCAWREIGGTRRWGSAVLTNALPLTEVHLNKNDYPGALTVARVTLPDGSTLFAVSVYG